MRVAGLPRPHLSLAQREALWGYGFIAPYVLGFIFFTAYPVAAVFYLGFTDYDALRPPLWVGLNNYIAISSDPTFYKSIFNTVFYVTLAVPGQLLVSFGAALLLNRKIKGVGFWRAVYYLPVVIPYVVSSVLLVWFLDPGVGILKYVLNQVGLPAPLWLLDETWAKPAIVLLSLWYQGSYMIIFLAGLQAIPQQLFEAAEIDGAGPWRKMLLVTIPLLTPTVLFNLVIGIIGSFQVFTFAYIMTGGGPLQSTLFYVYYVYNRAFRFFDMGYAAALASILFVVVLTLTLAVFKWSDRWVYYEGAQAPRGGA